MGRKTIQVTKILRWANIRLSVPDAATPMKDMTPQAAYRLGVAHLLETILHDTGNYHGFGYLQTPFKAGETDESARRYYIAPILAGEYDARIAAAETRPA